MGLYRTGLKENEMDIEKIGGSNTKWNADTIEQRRKVITGLVNRKIDFDVVLKYSHHGEKITCELCGGKEERTGYWCKPCIHHSWCCVCCILLGIPNYHTGVYIIG